MRSCVLKQSGSSINVVLPNRVRDPLGLKAGTPVDSESVDSKNGHRALRGSIAQVVRTL